ncbi:collagen alpha-2(I) chain-like [Bos javanicus]|uniref:collagen alpha-2(I) chain-like n=1 Tax=Bos javanicus TaxID=9906 RepID=UPI002AA62831|nr:collagen alpha-2(I) chain-like [Bos javanicus]
MVGAGRGGPRHAEQRAGRAAPSIHARPGREAAAGAGTASPGRPARALARAAPRAGGAAGRRRRRWRRRQLGAGRSARVSEGHWNAELSVTGSSAYSGARPLPCSAGSARSRRLAAAGGGAGTPGVGRAEGRREREAGRAGFCGSVASRAAPAPGPQPGRTGQCALPLPTRADSRRPPPPPSRPPPTPPPATLPPPTAPPPDRPAGTRAEAARCHLGGGGDERPGPPSPAAYCAPDSRARIGATGDATGIGRHGPSPPAGGVRGSHAHLPRFVLACCAGRASARGLAAGRRPRAAPACPRGTQIPGAFVASRQEGPEHSGETIVTGQTASGRTWSLAVTREGTRQSQAAGGTRGCPGSADPRRPVVNCRIGLEQSPPASACRRWPPGCKCGGSTRWLGARPPARMAWNPATASRVTAGSSRTPRPPLSGSRTWMLRSRARRLFRPVERRSLNGHWASVTFGCPPHRDGRERAGARANRWPVLLERVGEDTRVSGNRGFLEAELWETAAWGSRSSSESSGGADRGALHSLPGTPGRREGPAAMRPEVVRTGGEGALWPADAASSPPRWAWRRPQPLRAPRPGLPHVDCIRGKRTATLERLNKA